ncbi:hypothetical protein SUDANB176_05477 [Streptomyces sp. enrichment culture]
MGVFARIFRRSKATEETRTDEVRTGETRADETRTGEAAAEPKAEDATEAAEMTTSAEASKTAEPAVKEADEVTGTDSVEIPKQQSSGAADSESGEGART